MSVDVRTGRLPRGFQCLSTAWEVIRSGYPLRHFPHLLISSPRTRSEAVQQAHYLRMGVYLQFPRLSPLDGFPRPGFFTSMCPKPSLDAVHEATVQWVSEPNNHRKDLMAVAEVFLSARVLPYIRVLRICGLAPIV